MANFKVTFFFEVMSSILEQKVLILPVDSVISAPKCYCHLAPLT